MLSSDVGRWTKVQKQLDATVCHYKLVQRPIHACMCLLWTTPLCAIAPPLCLMPIKHLEISIWKYEEKWQWKPFWNMFFFFSNCQMALFYLALISSDFQPLCCLTLSKDWVFKKRVLSNTLMVLSETLQKYSHPQLPCDIMRMLFFSF